MAASSVASSSAELQALERLPDAAVRTALHQLPDGFRVAVYLADVEGFSYKEIADMMGTPIGTVMSRLHRGRAHLKAALHDYARHRGLVPALDLESTPSRVLPDNVGVGESE